MQVIVPRNLSFSFTYVRHNLFSRTLLIKFRPTVIFAKRNIMENRVKSSTFDFSKYNCIGFDLDNTICRYKLSNLVQLEYEAMTKFLVEQKNYDPKVLDHPVDFDFLQKGVSLDFDRGNILRVTGTGKIWRASHGTRIMSDEEIVAKYGENRSWDVTTMYVDDPLVTWNGPLSEKIRSLLDYFDMPAALAFARIVDDIDKKNGGPLKEDYKVWPDVLDGLFYMFARANYSAEDGGHYFNNLRSNPEKYINRCTPEAIQWLKEIKKTKKTFLITGSHIDFATYTASNSLGPDWKDLFDIVISFARKPAFFTSTRPFIKLDNAVEGDPIPDITAISDSCVSVSQGNWQELLQFLQIRLGGEQPTCLYIGDNVVQDLYAPAHFTRCDTLAVIEELWAENDIQPPHPEKKVITSNIWGSYFGTSTTPSMWHNFLAKSSQLIVPSFETLAQLPLQGPIPTGYYPELPKSHKQ